MVARDVPALILLDLNMPCMDGTTFLQELRRRRLCTGTPVIVLTAAFDASPDTASLLESLGVRTHFAKPFDLDDLLVQVAAILHEGGVIASVDSEADWFEG